tara:strand:- start:79 stop:1101 length:1023 start_codon:yes stop_codon:yes gene_type:complete
MKLSMTVRHTQNKYEPITAHWNIRNNSLANRWVELLKHNILEGSHPLEKTYCLKAWTDSWNSDYSRNAKFLCDQLNQAIEQINNSDLGYHIDLQFSVKKLRSFQYRTLMNDIHHHFELLIGQEWCASEWYKRADSTTRDSIRQLNNLCHEIEHMVRAIKRTNLLRLLGIENRQASVFVSQNGKGFDGKYIQDRVKWEITEEEFSSFEFGGTWGDIELYYSQLGKPHKDAWKDNDKFIDDNNISSTRYITGEFHTIFCTVFKRATRFPLGFQRWLKKNNFPIERRYGAAVVAETTIKTYKEKKQFIKELLKRDDLYQITLLDDLDNVIASRTFDYTWQDQV